MVLVDSSSWIDYFQSGDEGHPIDDLLANNELCTNDIILAELIPSITHLKERSLLGKLIALNKFPLRIDWDRIVKMQILNLRSGINKVGIPDLLVAQNALEFDLQILSNDKHFALMAKVHGFKLY